jgi:hypothetical protein
MPKSTSHARIASHLKLLDLQTHSQAERDGAGTPYRVDFSDLGIFYLVGSLSSFSRTFALAASV